jgi:hypothetical protein
MSTRKNPFATLAEASFEPKPPRAQPLSDDAIERIAQNRNFPSREASKPKAEPARRQRRYRTGRNQHIGIRATAETVERFYKAVDARNLPMGELLKQALDALDRAGGSIPNQE